MYMYMYVYVYMQVYDALVRTSSPVLYTRFLYFTNQSRLKDVKSLVIDLPEGHLLIFKPALPACDCVCFCCCFIVTQLVCFPWHRKAVLRSAAALSSSFTQRALLG